MYWTWLLRGSPTPGRVESVTEQHASVRIKSADPLAPPAIQFNFLASDYDFQALIYGARLSRKIAAQPALKPFVGEEVIPGEA